MTILPTTTIGITGKPYHPQIAHNKKNEKNKPKRERSIDIASIQ